METLGKVVTLVLAGSTALMPACGLIPVASSAPYTVHRDEVYASPQGQALRADVYVPRGEGPFPAVLVIHGGGWVRGERADMTQYAERLATDGYVAVNITYRLAPASVFPAQLEDCRAAVTWIRDNASRFRADPERVGALGYSAGAHLALLLGVTDDAARVQAVIAGAGPSDLRRYPDSKLVQALLGGGPGGREHLYFDASPIAHVTPDDAPVFLYHGRMDRLVEIEQSRMMAEKMRSAGVEVVMQEEPFGHVLTYFWDGDALDHATRFLGRHLRPAL